MGLGGHIRDNGERKQGFAKCEVRRNPSWISMKTAMVDYLLLIETPVELERWNNNLLANIKDMQAYQLREIALMINVRRDQLTQKIK